MQARGAPPGARRGPPQDGAERRQPSPRRRSRRCSSEPAPEAAEQAEPAATAEIIDISARVNDQLYDQYTDAANRAVGD